jgi:dimethylargininase
MLGALGARVERVEAAPDLPDSVFIEDTAVVVDEIAVLMRPGASSRRPEVDAVAAALGRYRPLQSIVAPGTMDGGDVLRAGRRVFVGLSLGRTTTLCGSCRRSSCPSVMQSTTSRSNGVCT